MGKLHFIWSIFLFAQAARVNGGDINVKLPQAEGKNPFKPQMTPLTPAEIEIKPSFGQESNAINPLTQGRLLTPDEGCGFSAAPNTRIVGGAPAKNGAWPWMALLGYKMAGGGGVSFNCGGSLITSRHVLTAAHCLNTNLWFVRLGEYDIRTIDDGPHEDIEVLRWEPHQQYDSRLIIHDIGMIYLNRDVIFNDRIRVVCLPLEEPLRSEKILGLNPFAVGWGVLREHGQQSPVLMQLQVPIVNNKFCKMVYKKNGLLEADIQFSDITVCAGMHDGQSSCHGDSGGPLMLPVHNNGKFPFYQIGIVSWGLPCAHAEVPAIYVSVRHYAKWISKMLEK